MMEESEKDIEKRSDWNVHAGLESQEHGVMVIYQFMSCLQDKTINIKLILLQNRKGAIEQDIPMTSFLE